MPRNEQRPIIFTRHALERLEDRSITAEEAEVVVRGGAWHPDGTGRNGEPKWIAEGSIKGHWIKVAFIETSSGKIEILRVLTVMD